MKEHWTLEPDLHFLNHGSFGACPRSVLAVQQALRDELERQPVAFLMQRHAGLLDEARAALAGFLGADAADLVAVTNATTGVNTVLRSLTFEPGDELLCTDHGYNACRNALHFVAERWGAKVVTARVPFPLQEPGEVTEAILAATSEKTRLAVIDHVTSPTGLVFPIAEVVRRLDERGIDVLVDGAHGPGMEPLDLTALGAAYYTGNCHKWLCAPKGAAFLHVRADRQEAIRPLVISHGTNRPRSGRSRFHDEFDWVGTDDPTAFLAVPAALAWLGALLPGGWEELRRRNRDLVLEGRQLVAAVLGVEPPCPPEMIGSLAALPLPDGSPEPPGSALYADPLHDLLLEEYRIEVPIVPWPQPPKRLIRVSAQIYNRIEDYQALARALPEALDSRKAKRSRRSA